MEPVISKDDLCHHLHTIHLDKPETFSAKADKELRLLTQTEYARFSGLTENLTAFVVKDKHHWNYAAIVDSLDPSKGLNNFADGALTLAGAYKADAKHWSLASLTSNPEFIKLKQTFSEESNAASPLNPSDLQPLAKFTKRNTTEPSKRVLEVKETHFTKPEPPIANNRVPLPPSNPLNSFFSAYDRTKSPPAKIPRQDAHSLPIPLPSKPVDSKTEKNSGFRSAHEQLVIDNLKQGHNPANPQVKKSLGLRLASNPSSKFVPPYKTNKEEGTEKTSCSEEEIVMDERLKNIDPKMIELILNEIMDHGSPITWNDIAGLEFAKKTIQEIVVWPMLRPDIFSGLRGPPKGLLLFGPPGTGKTLIGKCIAAQSKSTFFSISASSLTSKWIGEGEKMVRALFAVARTRQPAVIFIDEIDSLLSQRSDTEHESSRRLKTEFLVQLDGATTTSEDRLLVVGATNRPQELDEAARRRLVKRLYIPLPESQARRQIIENLMVSQANCLTTEQIEDVCRRSEGYSGADMANLCKEAALGPIRSISPTQMAYIEAENVRPIVHEDFIEAISNVRASVSEEDLGGYLEWNKRFGSGGR